MIPVEALETNRRLERLLAEAEAVRTERGDPRLTASHILVALDRLHPGLLTRLAGLSNGAVHASAGATDLGAEEALRVAEERARAESADRVDVRHVAIAVVDELGLEPPPVRPDAPPGLSTPGDTPILDQWGRDLTALARAGSLPPIIGRDREVDQLIEVLSRRIKRSALLVGPPGVGKTAVVESLAQRLMRGDVPAALRGRRLVEITAAELMTRVGPDRLPDAMHALVDETQQARALLFIDDFAAAVLLGGPHGGLSAHLRPLLARGELAVVGAVTEGEYEQILRTDPGLERRFDLLRVEELPPPATRAVLDRLARELDDGVALDESALDAVVSLADRYLRNRRFPDKAIDLLDRTAARARARRVPADADLVADVVADLTGLPLGAQEQGLTERVGTLAAHLKKTVIGQEEAIEEITPGIALRTRGFDLRPERPNGVFLFTGPTGVGKTETARRIAEHLFGSPDRIVRLDMSEYGEPHYAAKLVGAPPGYVGYQEGSAWLREIAARPFTVLLLDEIEKAHPSVQRLFLQVFDAGFLTGGDGTRVYFSDAIIVMTANVDLRRSRAGFVPDVPRSDLDALDGHFPPEFINRLDAVCRFSPLRRDHVRRILREVVLPRWLSARRSQLDLQVTEAALDHLVEVGYSDEWGARELHRVVERELLTPVMQAAAPGEAMSLRADCRQGRLVVETAT